MVKYLLKPLLVVLFFSAISGCELINPEEDQPAYLHITKPAFSAGGAFGSDSHEILSGWVYFDGRLIGVFDLPADVPVLESDSTRITVEAGVVIDGQRATRGNYPFYTRYNETLHLTPGQNYEIEPKFTFLNFVQQPVYRDFESDDAIQTPFAINAPYELERRSNLPADPLFFANGGDYFGYVQSAPDTVTPIEIVSNVSGMALSQAGKPVYAEFDLRSTRNVDVGLQVMRNGMSEGIKAELKILPSNTWKKFYVNLENEVNSGYQLGGNPTYKLIFRSVPSASGTDYIAVDNIRLIQYP